MAKYKNVKTNGYASKKEAKRARELKLLQAAGKIRNLQEQVRFEIIPKQDGERAAHYVADFVYEYEHPLLTLKPEGDPREPYWATEVEDCKGMKTPAYVLKRKLMLHVHGIRVRET